MNSVVKMTYLRAFVLYRMVCEITALLRDVIYKYLLEYGNTLITFDASVKCMEISHEMKETKDKLNEIMCSNEWQIPEGLMYKVHSHIVAFILLTIPLFEK